LNAPNICVVNKGRKRRVRSRCSESVIALPALGVPRPPERRRSF
jgi:hypothetical protein